jgi:hypothetical protein
MFYLLLRTNLNTCCCRDTPPSIEKVAVSVDVLAEMVVPQIKGQDIPSLSTVDAYKENSTGRITATTLP